MKNLLLIMIAAFAFNAIPVVYADEEPGSVVLIHPCRSAATRRVSFTSILTASDLIRYCAADGVVLLLLVVGVPGREALELTFAECCAGPALGAEAELLAPVVAAPPQAATSNARIIKPVEKRARWSRFFVFVEVVMVCGIDSSPFDEGR